MNLKLNIYPNKLWKINFYLNVFLTVWIFGFIAPVIFDNQNLFAVIFPFLKYNYSLVCHQDVSKSFLIGNSAFLVCSRCSGIYIGAFLSSIASFFISRPIRSLKWIYIAFTPMLGDVALYTTGIYEYNKTAAFITGLFSGAILFLYILQFLENIILKSAIVSHEN